MKAFIVCALVVLAIGTRCGPGYGNDCEGQYAGGAGGQQNNGGNII